MNNDILIPPESAVHRLRRNDPAVTEITIILCDELRTDRALASALSENEHVTHVTLVVFSVGRLFFRGTIPSNRWSALRDVLAKKTGLRKIACYSEFFAEDQQLPPQTSAVLKLLALPRLRARNLCLLLRETGTFHAEVVLSRLLQALQRNFSLFSVRTIIESSNATDFFVDGKASAIDATDDTMVYQFWRYLRRNKRLADWIANPELVPKHLWPEALNLARQAGHDALFQSLQTVLGMGYAKSLSGRKRKRAES